MNLLEDHQDYHTSFEQYWATKLKLFANQTNEDAAIFNVDDPRVAQMLGTHAQEYSARIVKSTGASIRHAAMDDRNKYGACVRHGSLGWRLADDFIDVIEVEKLPLLGAHNVSNAAAALAAVRAAIGDEVFAHRDTIREAMLNFQSLPHRLEIVARKNGLTWVNDSQATIPDATIGALRSFDGPITLIAGGQDKLNDVNGYDKLGQVIAERAQLLITIGKAAELIEKATLQAGNNSDNIISAGVLQEAVRQAKQRTPQGGTVLLSPACSSFDQFKSFEERGETFRRLVLNEGVLPRGAVLLH